MSKIAQAFCLTAATSSLAAAAYFTTQTFEAYNRYDEASQSKMLSDRESVEWAKYRGESFQAIPDTMVNTVGATALLGVSVMSATAVYHLRQTRPIRRVTIGVSRPLNS